MLDQPAGSKRRPPSWRKVWLTIGVTTATLLALFFAVLHLGRELSARQVLWKTAMQIELELALSKLRFEEAIHGDASISQSRVQQHLALADSHARQVQEICVESSSTCLFGNSVALEQEVEAFRQQLASFTPEFGRQWQQWRQALSSYRTPVEFDETFQQLTFRARRIKTSADQILRMQQLAFQLVESGLIIGVLLVAGFALLTLRHFFIGHSEAEAALRESEAKFRSVFEMSNDAILLLDQVHIFDCNEAALRAFEVADKEALCRMHPADISPPTQPDGTDSDAAADERIATALQQGSHRFEWMHRRGDGAPFPTEVVLSRLQIGGRVVLQALVRDVTQRKEAEELLKANEEKFRKISDAALDAVIMMDAQGRVAHWNPAAEQMFGFSPQEILGREIHSLLTPDRFRSAAHASMSDFFRTGQGRAVGKIMELEAIRKGGVEFPIEISVAPIRVDQQWWAVAVVRDITDRRRADDTLRREQRTLRRLLKSHDQERKLIAYEIHDGLAQQLVAAIMQCQTASRVVEHDPEESQEIFLQLLTLLRQCLGETRRLISGVRPPILDEFGVVTAIEGLIEEVRTRGGPHVEFVNRVAFERLEPVLENTVYRVIQEGLQNACRHSRSPNVEIELTQLQDRILIRVQDWGTGFDPQLVDAKRFGLAGIRERVRLMGGTVKIESTIGVGTSVEAELPQDVGDLADID